MIAIRGGSGKRPLPAVNVYPDGNASHNVTGVDKLPGSDIVQIHTAPFVLRSGARCAKRRAKGWVTRHESEARLFDHAIRLSRFARRASRASA